MFFCRQLHCNFLSFSELFGGAVLVEQKYLHIPELDRLQVSAGLRSDVPLLLGIVIFSAIFVYVGNLIADIILQLCRP